MILLLTDCQKVKSSRTLGRSALIIHPASSHHAGVLSPHSVTRRRIVFGLGKCVQDLEGGNEVAIFMLRWVSEELKVVWHTCVVPHLLIQLLTWAAYNPAPPAPIRSSGLVSQILVKAHVPLYRKRYQLFLQVSSIIEVVQRQTLVPVCLYRFWCISISYRLLSLFHNYVKSNPASEVTVCVDLSTGPTIGHCLLFIINLLSYITHEDSFSDKTLISKIGTGSGSRGTRTLKMGSLN
ncbi:uncharacterized protein LOC118021392 [Mirounga leonina]|uniref:uncharacterized protein LOC118021392 n=1 Tax=Mirounga leonina TaxID=9715 RepID=UPI00156C0E42|nr:uncharacterized protein LOC118021392 [Mirounga leonina]